ncbi:MAG: phospholipase A [Gammaproteobacteria bacterium]|nr:phospholipase A [Gammaproteobacteria bacterium]
MGAKQYYSYMLAGMVLLCATAVAADDVVMGKNAAVADGSVLERCLLERLKQAAVDTSVSELREYCRQVVAEEEEASVVSARLSDERLIENNPFVITAHKPNYVLPVTYNSRPNETPYADMEGRLQNLEVKFQLSLKFQVASGVLGRNSLLFFAYTNQSYWQAYNSEFSSPFRETNHEPEVFLLLPQQWSLFGLRNRVIVLGLNHQSNGQPGSQSRSWNRLYANFVFERRNMVLSLRPWYRIPEESKSSATDPSGDDNPDILDYMGHGELRAIYKHGRNTYSLMLRNNLRRTNRGAVELGWSFPMGERLKGYVQYFNGYGESLIDYDARVNRLGVGIALTDWL